MRQSSLRAKLGDGQPVFGLLSGNVEPMLAEASGLRGFDLYCLDAEHGSGSPGEAVGVVRACEAVGMAPLVRVRSLDPKLINQFLDAGIEGVMLPGVRAAEDVRRLVEAVKYLPAGRRGLAAVRANDWLLGPRPQAEWGRHANETTPVLPQGETLEALEALPALVKVSGVDGFFVGPRDLA